MGQAKDRKARLGDWYGRPVEPGHPDFIPPKKPEPVRPLLRFDFSGDVVRVLGARIEAFHTSTDRIEVFFVGGKREEFWPVVDATKIRGELTIGSREFGVVELTEYTETGCVFVRLQMAQERDDNPKMTECPSEDPKPRQEAPANLREAIASGRDMGHFRRRPQRAMVAMATLAAMATMVGLSAVSTIEPESSSRKR